MSATSFATRLFLVTLAFAGAVLLVAPEARAITYGEPDCDDNATNTGCRYPKRGSRGRPGRPRRTRYTAGAPGAGDDYFPYAGNGGYDVRHYDLDLIYALPNPAPAPLVGYLDGVATLDLVATQDLDRFNLDLRGLDVASVSVNGTPAAEVAPPAPGEKVEGAAYWQVQDDAARIWELTVQPRPKLKSGQLATVVIAYGGDTTRPRGIDGFFYGWVTTRDGAMVVNEVDGAMTWYPVSDHPTDKATYGFAITVPEGKVAVANGLQSQSSRSARLSTMTASITRWRRRPDPCTHLEPRR